MNAPLRVTREQVARFRAATQLLGARGAGAEEVAAGWGLQDSPPGAAALALLARVRDLAPGDYDERLLERRTLFATYNPRTAVSVVPAQDAGALAAALSPDDDASLHALVAPALADGSIGARDAVALTAAAVRDALDGRVLARDELHARLRDVLPPSLLPYCEGCRSHHLRRRLLVAVALGGDLCVPGRREGQAAFARPDQWLGTPPDVAAAAPEAPAALVRRFLHGWGPSSPRELAGWAGLTPDQARRAWSRVEHELVPVSREDARPAWALAADAEMLADPPECSGVSLLAAGDPLLLARDREVLFEDPAVRRAVWRPVGSPGVVMAGAEPRGLWRARKRGRRLAVTVTAIGMLGVRVRGAVEREVARMAPHRGCTAWAVGYD